MANLPPLEDLLNINPNQLPEYLLEFISDMLKKYNIKTSSTPPLDRCEAPVVVGRVERRTRADFKGLGPTFSGYHGSEVNGQINSRYRQDFNVIVDLDLFYPSTMQNQAAEAAWQIERAVIHNRGPFQTRFPGSNIHWLQTLHDPLDYKTKGETQKYSIRFEIQLVTLSIVPSKVINSLNFTMLAGGILYTAARFEREDSSENFSFAVEEGQVVDQVLEIKLQRDGRYITLDPKLDYYLVRTSSTYEPVTSLKIAWREDTGLYPNVGESFWVTYVVSTKVATNF